MVLMRGVNVPPILVTRHCFLADGLRHNINFWHECMCVSLLEQYFFYLKLLSTLGIFHLLHT
jgi:hypothetical protein